MLKLSEHYTAMQGEGPLTGVPTQFVRFGLCNMRCPGWPCDSLYAVLPEFRSEWERIEPDKLRERIYLQSLEKGAENICFTGGEPFIQPVRDLEELVYSVWKHNYTMEFFTNGSIEYPMWALSDSILIMQDWKLPGSGEHEHYRQEREENALRLRDIDGLKFVCKGQADLNAALRDWEYLTAEGLRATVWVGAAWGHMKESDIVEFVQKNKLPWRLNVQVHKFVYPGVERGI